MGDVPIASTFSSCTFDSTLSGGVLTALRKLLPSSWKRVSGSVLMFGASWLDLVHCTTAASSPWTKAPSHGCMDFAIANFDARGRPFRARTVRALQCTCVPWSLT